MHSINISLLTLLCLNCIYYINCEILVNATKRKCYRFKVAALPIYPFVIWNMKNKPPRLIGGVDVKILNVLAEKLCFSYEPVLPLQFQYGVKSKDGVWTGMIGMVANNRTDIGVPNSFVTNSRLEVVDYSSPYIFYSANFASSAPRKLAKITAIVRPFDKNLWLWLFISLIMMGLVTYGIIYLEFHMNYIHINWPLSTIYWWMFSIFIGKSSDLENNLRTCRCVIGLCRLCSLALLSAYSGMLVSELSLPSFTSPIDTFQDLAFRVSIGEYQCGSLRGTAIEAFFIASPEGFLKAIGSVMTNDENRCTSVNEALENVLSRNYAFIFVNPLLKISILKSTAEDYHISQGIFSFPSSICMNKDFPLKKEFRKLTSRSFEAGITNRFLELESEIIQIERKNHPKEELGHQILVEDLIGAFILLGIGYMAGTICFILETFSKRFFKINET